MAGHDVVICLTPLFRVGFLLVCLLAPMSTGAAALTRTIDPTA